MPKFKFPGFDFFPAFPKKKKSDNWSKDPIKALLDPMWKKTTGIQKSTVDNALALWDSYFAHMMDAQKTFVESTPDLSSLLEMFPMLLMTPKDLMKSMMELQELSNKFFVTQTKAFKDFYFKGQDKVYGKVKEVAEKAVEAAKKNADEEPETSSEPVAEIEQPAAAEETVKPVAVEAAKPAPAAKAKAAAEPKAAAKSTPKPAAPAEAENKPKKAPAKKPKAAAPDTKASSTEAPKPRVRKKAEAAPAPAAPAPAAPATPAPAAPAAPAPAGDNTAAAPQQ
ncbi:MAG: hypothetical protein IJ088_05590 [Clostridia bacterium]|nr:hypothetical protein [Clostridia bacterium]